MNQTGILKVGLAIALAGAVGSWWHAQASLPPEPPKPAVIELPAAVPDDADLPENSNDPAILAAVERGRELERQDIEDEQAVQDDEDDHRYDGVRGY